MGKRRQKIIATVYGDEETKEKLKKICEQRGITISQFVAECVNEKYVEVKN